MDWHPRVYKKDHTLYKEMKREEWRALRKECYERDDYSCCRCGKRSKSGQGISAHHLIPREEGGPDKLRNLVTLCNKCHDFVEMQGYRTLDEIERSAADMVEDEKKIEPKPAAEHVDVFNRPDWHAWVYGGARNPIKDRFR